MPRYYSVCEFTPSFLKGSRGSRYNKYYLRVYNTAPEGYIFHDSENPLDFNHLQRALYLLSSLYDESAKAVVGVRIDAKTIAVTFNTTGFPKPARDGGQEFISNNRLTGWLQENVRDPSCENIPVDFDDIYDQCVMLERFTGHCPCPKLDEGTCLPSTVYAQFPWLADKTATYSAPPSSEYKRVKYNEIDSFVYTPGQYSVKDDFTDAVRPWDNYDFSLVPVRKDEFSERGSSNARRHVHRKEVCSQCVFSTKKHTGTYEDCGQVNSCKNSITEDEAWTALYKWLDEATPYTTGNDAFALHEIHYLMSMADTDMLSRAITPTRNILTKLAGFSGRDTIRYRIVPCQGDTERRALFSSYAELRATFPTLPHSKDIPETHIDKKLVLAHAIYSTWSSIRSSGHQPHPVYSITHSRGEVHLTGTTSRSTFHASSLGLATHVMSYFRKLWPHRYHDTKNLLNYTWISPDHGY
jgi:hypothetical protein